MKNENVILLNELIEKIDSFKENSCSLSEEEKNLLNDCMKSLYALRESKSNPYEIKANLMAIVDIVIRVFTAYEFLKNLL